MMFLPALGLFLKSCDHVVTLGVRPQFSAYPCDQREFIRLSPLILFPTSRYVDLFKAIGKRTFPSAASHYFKRSRHLQWLLASYMNLPRIKTRLYAGRKKFQKILKDFRLPLKLLSVLNDRSNGYIVNTPEELHQALSKAPHSIMAQEHFPSSSYRTVEIVITTRLMVGLSLTSDRPVDPSIVEISKKMAHRSSLDDIMIRWIEKDKKTWLYAGMDFPPHTFLSMGKEVVKRKDILCEFAKEAATEWGLPVQKTLL